MSVESDHSSGVLNNDVENTYNKAEMPTTNDSEVSVATGLEQNHDVDIEVEESTQKLTKSLFDNPLVFGWFSLIIFIVGALILIIISEPRSTNVAQSTTNNTNETQLNSGDINTAQNDLDSSCRIRKDGSTDKSALSLDATEALQATQHKGQFGFSQEGCRLIVTVYKRSLTATEKENFESEISTIVNSNLSPEASNKVKVDFTYPLQ